MKRNLTIRKDVRTDQRELPSLLSRLWIFLSCNYILCDLLTLMERDVLNNLMKGTVGGIQVTQNFLLMAGISLEIPFLMIVLSITLGYQGSRLMNIGAASLMFLYQAASFFFGSDATLHYIFFSVVEMTGNAIILFLAAGWKAGVSEERSV